MKGISTNEIRKKLANKQSSLEKVYKQLHYRNNAMSRKLIIIGVCYIMKNIYYDGKSNLESFELSVNTRTRVLLEI